MGENALCVRQCQELAAFFQKRTKKDFPAFRKRLSPSLREGVHPEQNVRSEGRSPAPPSAACPVLFPRHSLMTHPLCCATTPAHALSDAGNGRAYSAGGKAPRRCRLPGDAVGTPPRTPVLARKRRAGSSPARKSAAEALHGASPARAHRHVFRFLCARRSMIAHKRRSTNAPTTQRSTGVPVSGLP